MRRIADIVTCATLLLSAMAFGTPAEASRTTISGTRRPWRLRNFAHPAAVLLLLKFIPHEPDPTVKSNRLLVEFKFLAC